MNEDEQGLLELEPNLVAKTTFKGGGNDYETEKQKEVMELLRDHYNGVIYDPKERTEIREIRLASLVAFVPDPKRMVYILKRDRYE